MGKETRGGRNTRNFSNKALVRYRTVEPEQGGISRRRFLSMALVGGGIVITGGAAGVVYLARESEKESAKLVEGDLQAIIGETVEEFNETLGQNLSGDLVRQKAKLVTNLPEYRGILAKEWQGGVGDELNIPGITTSDNSGLYLYGPSFEDRAKKKGVDPKKELKSIFIHELGHFNTLVTPASATFMQALVDVYGSDLLKGVSDKSNWKIKGANIQAGDGDKKQTLHGSVDEAEAVLMWDAIHSSHGRDPRDMSSYSYERERAEMLRGILVKVDPDYNKTLRDLARTRTIPGGREEWCDILGEAFKIKPELRLEFGVQIFYAIDNLSPKAIPDVIR